MLLCGKVEFVSTKSTETMPKKTNPKSPKQKLVPAPMNVNCTFFLLPSIIVFIKTNFDCLKQRITNKNCSFLGRKDRRIGASSIIASEYSAQGSNLGTFKKSTGN